MQYQNYKTPPYLTVVPEITHHKLNTRDKFMVLATDGLWDMMTPMQVIRLVGEHMSGKVVLKPLVLGQRVRRKNFKISSESDQVCIKSFRNAICHCET